MNKLVQNLLIIVVVSVLYFAALHLRNFRTVCDRGCDYPNAQLQSAIEDAKPGMTIYLQPGFTYVAPSSGYLIPDEKPCEAQDQSCTITLSTRPSLLELIKDGFGLGRSTH